MHELAEHFKLEFCEREGERIIARETTNIYLKKVNYIEISNK